MISLAKIITGADLTVTKIMMEGTNDSVIDEFRLREFLEENVVERGGLIKGFTFQTM